eukprot:352058-Chlamydomonas_euryale.AAC.9
MLRALPGASKDRSCSGITSELQCRTAVAAQLGATLPIPHTPEPCSPGCVKATARLAVTHPASPPTHKHTHTSTRHVLGAQQQQPIARPHLQPHTHPPHPHNHHTHTL